MGGWPVSLWRTRSMTVTTPKQRISSGASQQGLPRLSQTAAAVASGTTVPIQRSTSGTVMTPPSRSDSRRSTAPPRSFMERQEDLLKKTGRANATSASRVAIPMNDGLDDESTVDDRASVAESVASKFSRAPSVHPSLAGSVCSIACSEITIGAGDDTGYWDFQHRVVEKKDLGQKCRECKQAFATIGEPLTERRGARISMRYHGECFSGFADPRSQSRSSHHEGQLAGTQLQAAPSQKAGSKMRTSSHFEGGRVAAGVGGKFGGQMGMGHNSFGSKSSKGKMPPIPERRPGGLTEGQLADHDKQQQPAPVSLELESAADSAD